MKISDIMRRVNPLLLSELVHGQCAQASSASNDFLPVVNKQHQYVGIINKDKLTSIVGAPVLSETNITEMIDPSFPTVIANCTLDKIPENLCQALVLDEAGNVVGILSAEKLINALCKTIHEFDDRFSAVIDSAMNGIFAVDNQGLIIVANRVVGEILGIPREQLIGRQVAELIPNTLMPVILKSQKPLLGQKISLANTIVIANYSPILSDGEIIGAVSVFQDISILENTSSELNYVKSLMHELEAIINSSYDGIFITDGQGVVLRVNHAYERITGINADEVIGKNMGRLVEEDYYDKSVTLLVMEKKERLTINQTIKKDHNVLVTGNPIFDENGDLFRVVTNVRDITELTQLQEQLTKTKEQTLKYKTELSHLRSLQIQQNEIIFRSRSMGQAIAVATKVAEVDSTVLITGESGTGKELIAKLIHQRGKGIDKPFIKINCAALPEQLLESELFGYESGAFTGAKKEGKPGLFELAHNGTLFLDEVGDMPLVLQVKLLRSIQEKEILRVGGMKPIKVNVRIIAATHRNLSEMVEKGIFRKDLYYRLMVVPIHLASLRDRKEDVPLLIVHFLEKFNQRFGYNKTVSPHAFNKLIDYGWPGNVRELENVIERMIVTSIDDELSVEHLPETFTTRNFLPKKGTKLKAAVEQAEAFLLEETYKEHPSWQKVAEVLDVDRATIYRKAKGYGLLK